MPAMGLQSAEQIAQRAFDLDLLTERQLQEVWAELGHQPATPDQFVRTLLRRELLTNYQVERLLKGERGGFFYGDYKVLYLVASGSFARVYRAAHRESGKVVALKVLRRRFVDDVAQDGSATREQFYREGQMGRTLRHPNIVPIHDVVSEGRTHYIVMEFVEGHNLREFLKVRKKIDPIEATKLVIDVASGLAYAFGRGVSHRDLKLTNVLVSSRGQAKLVDFGLAGVDESVDDGAEANPRTIDYAGLERATGVRKDDQRSDIYFTGCIYYHLLTGKPPLQETKDRIQRLSKQRYLDVEPIQKAEPGLPRSVVAVVSKAMDLDPEKRHQTPTELLVDLQITLERLQKGVDIAGEDGAEAKGADDPQERARWEALLVPQSMRRSVMFVESDSQMQDRFREGMKRAGYRVLLTSDPDRALARFSESSAVADCVVFSSSLLGERCLEAFNQFGQRAETAKIPALLLLGERQRAWKSRAETNDHRIVLSMPIKLRQLRDLLTRIVPPLDGQAAN